MRGYNVDHLIFCLWKLFVEPKTVLLTKQLFVDSRHLNLCMSLHSTEILTSYKGIYTVMQIHMVKLISWCTFFFFHVMLAFSSLVTPSNTKSASSQRVERGGGEQLVAVPRP